MMFAVLLGVMLTGEQAHGRARLRSDYPKRPLAHCLEEADAVVIGTILQVSLTSAPPGVYRISGVICTWNVHLTVEKVLKGEEGQKEIVFSDEASDLQDFSNIYQVPSQQFQDKRILIFLKDGKRLRGTFSDPPGGFLVELLSEKGHLLNLVKNQWPVKRLSDNGYDLQIKRDEKVLHGKLNKSGDKQFQWQGKRLPWQPDQVLIGPKGRWVLGWRHLRYFEEGGDKSILLSLGSQGNLTGEWKLSELFDPAIADFRPGNLSPISAWEQLPEVLPLWMWPEKPVVKRDGQVVELRNMAGEAMTLTPLSGKLEKGSPTRITLYLRASGRFEKVALNSIQRLWADNPGHVPLGLLSSDSQAAVAIFDLCKEVGIQVGEPADGTMKSLLVFSTERGDVDYTDYYHLIEVLETDRELVVVCKFDSSIHAPSQNTLNLEIYDLAIPLHKPIRSIFR